MNSSSPLMMTVYMAMMEHHNLTHLLEPGMNSTQLAQMLEDNFPLPPDMLFSSASVISISVYSVQLVVGLAANCYSLVHLLRERLVLHNKNRMILLLIHLTCANLCVILIGIPLEIAWTATVSWWADGVTCKIKNCIQNVRIFRIFGYLISGNVLMAISLDRFSAIVFPISHRSSAHRTRWLLVAAWTMAVLCSIPQSVVFSLQTHPIVSTYRQCMNTITITNKKQELLYFFYIHTISWLLPIIVMLICYVSIIITICRRTKLNHLRDNTRKPATVGSQTLPCRLIGKAEMKTIKVTGVLILGFFLTWCPYQINCLWYYFNRHMFELLDPHFQKLLWNFVSVANVINPFLYAMYDYVPAIGCRKVTNSGHEQKDDNDHSSELLLSNDNDRDEMNNI